MSDKKLKQDARKIYALLLRAYASARRDLFEAAWRDVDKSLDLLIPIVDGIVSGKIAMREGED